MSTEKKPRFEDYLRQVEEAVRSLESGKLGLDESMERYEQGVAALKQCRRLLEQAELKIQMLVQQKDGSLSTEDLEPEGRPKRKRSSPESPEPE